MSNANTPRTHRNSCGPPRLCPCRLDGAGCLFRKFGTLGQAARKLQRQFSIGFKERPLPMLSHEIAAIPLSLKCGADPVIDGRWNEPALRKNERGFPSLADPGILGTGVMEYPNPGGRIVSFAVWSGCTICSLLLRAFHAANEGTSASKPTCLAARDHCSCADCWTWILPLLLPGTSCPLGGGNLGADCGRCDQALRIAGITVCSRSTPVLEVRCRSVEEGSLHSDIGFGLSLRAPCQPLSNGAT